MRKTSIALATAVFLILTPQTHGATSKAAAGASPKLPKLILQITVDQLRGDLPLRYQSRFGPSGFRYFIDHGTWYAAAFHPHAHTETVVGHTTLATGTYPSRHGMVANVWYDRETGQFVNNIEGPQYPLLSVTGETQNGLGASPITILTTTFSDELNLHTAGRSKIYSVSAKDRGAVPLAGHNGKAFWYSTTNGCFVSSTYYYATYPDWVTAACKANPSKRFENTTWTLLKDRSTYVYRDWNNQYPAGTNPASNMAALDSFKFGHTFPHKIAAGPALYNAITVSPAADELTLDFAKKIITEEKLGKGHDPDYLAISFSATDLTAHWFSHASLESEDSILRLDAHLSDLFAFVDKEVGLDNTLIVISGDHGGPDYPEYLAQSKIDSGWITPAQITGAATKALATSYPNVKGLIAEFSTPYLYIDHSVVAANKLDEAEVERVIAKGIETIHGIALALPATDLLTNVEADPELVEQIRRNYNAHRSGDVYIAQSPQWQILEAEAGGSSAPLLQHGSPWRYDTYVPVAFAGAGVPKNMVYRQIYTIDVAATLSAFVRARYPSASVGVPLKEVLGAKGSATAAAR